MCQESFFMCFRQLAPRWRSKRRPAVSDFYIRERSHRLKMSTAAQRPPCSSFEKMSGRFLPAAAISSEARKTCAEQRDRDRLRYKAGHYSSWNSQDLTLRLALRILRDEADKSCTARRFEL